MTRAAPDRAHDERILVLAPTGRDAAVTCEVLAGGGFSAWACADMGELCRELMRGAGGLVIAVEALTGSGLASLNEALAAQPPWSDVPILVSAGAGETGEARTQAIGALAPTGNVTLLERPIRVYTMKISVQAMLRARRRQYQMRDLHQQLQRQMEHLQGERELRARFVSMLAHDLRGPVSAASLAAQMLIRAPERLDQRRDYAVRIERNLKRVEQMVRDLLDTSRLQAGRPLPLRLDDCELGTIAAEVVEELNLAHQDRVRLQADPGLHGVWSAEELRRALWNLVTNAIKYGAPEAPVTVALRRTSEGVRLTVHNEGKPIAREDLERMFEPFARTRAAEGSTQVGWGLGLTLVRGCVEAHGGRLRVESDAERGTTFSIELPLDARPFQLRAIEPPGMASGPEPCSLPARKGEPAADGPVPPTERTDVFGP